MRGKRKTLSGVVVSDRMHKTIVVRVDSLKKHPRFKKVFKTSNKFYAHDEENKYKIGDQVKIMETRPLSKTKRWRVIEG